MKTVFTVCVDDVTAIKSVILFLESKVDTD